MRKIDYVDLFVKVDDDIICLEKEDKLKSCLNLKRNKLKEAKLCVSELLTLIILYRFSGKTNLKYFWFEHKHIRKEFPNIPSYSTFINWFNRLNKILIILLNKRLVNLHGELGFIDSTKIETSRPYKRGKIHKLASKGYSSLGSFNGFKLHILINENKQICNYQITTGSCHDLTVVKEGFLNKQTGKILADSGYVSREVYYNLMDKNLILIAKPRNSMLENNSLGLGYLPDWDFNFKKLYKKRMSIERLFDFFKDKLNLVSNKSHSTNGLFAHIISTLLANQMLANNEIAFNTF